MKIRKLEIKNYKIFDEVMFDFTDKNGNTKDAIIIAGLNGTGKTTVLELINDILGGNIIKNIEKNFEIFIELDFSGIGWYDKFLSQIEYSQNEFLSEFSIKDNFLKIYYNHSNSKLKTIIDFQKFAKIFNDLQKNLNEKVKGIYKYSNDKFKPKSKRDFSNFFQEVSFHTNKNDMKNLILKPINKQIYKNLNTPPKEIIDRELMELNSIFKQIKFNSRLTNIEADELIFTSKNGHNIKFEDLSSGEKQVCFAGFFLSKLNISNSMIVVDEPEDSLHPSWQNEILNFYKSVGTYNQIIIATHSPQIIASAKPEQVYLLKTEKDKIVVKQPKYSKGHSIPFVLSEIMETSYKNSSVNEIVSQYLALIRKGKHKTAEGNNLWKEIEKLSPESEERVKVEFSLERYNAIGK